MTEWGKRDESENDQIRWGLEDETCSPVSNERVSQLSQAISFCNACELHRMIQLTLLFPYRRDAAYRTI